METHNNPESQVSSPALQGDRFAIKGEADLSEVAIREKVLNMLLDMLLHFAYHIPQSEKKEPSHE
jgi:hypothetical protein